MSNNLKLLSRENSYGAVTVHYKYQRKRNGRYSSRPGQTTWLEQRNLPSKITAETWLKSHFHQIYKSLRQDFESTLLETKINYLFSQMVSFDDVLCYCLVRLSWFPFVNFLYRENIAVMGLLLLLLTKGFSKFLLSIPLLQPKACGM